MCIIPSVSVVFSQTEFTILCSQTALFLCPFPLLKFLCFPVIQSQMLKAIHACFSHHSRDLQINSISLLWLASKSLCSTPVATSLSSDSQCSSVVRLQCSSHWRTCLIDYCHHPWHELRYINLSNMKTLIALFLWKPQQQQDRKQTNKKQSQLKN